MYGENWDTFPPYIHSVFSHNLKMKKQTKTPIFLHWVALCLVKKTMDHICVGLFLISLWIIIVLLQVFKTYDTAPNFVFLFALFFKYLSFFIFPYTLYNIIYLFLQRPILEFLLGRHGIYLHLFWALISLAMIWRSQCRTLKVPPNE